MSIEGDLYGVDLFGEPVRTDTDNSIVKDRFLLPPFSILDARSGFWQDRKRRWISLGIESEVGRDEGLTYTMDSDYGRRTRGEAEGDPREAYTSIFDPVLCELVYRWFAPENGLVLDPFAGGSVRGIVAAKLGRGYWGSELRDEQVRANRRQATDLLEPVRPVVEDLGGVRVVRDDLIPGGTKERALLRYLPTLDGDEFVYATSASGFAQLAIARAARALGKRTTIFVSARSEPSEVTTEARLSGADVREVRPGYLSVVEARAREYAEESGATLLPLGLDTPEFVAALAEVVRETCDAPREAWSVAGSGALQRAMQLAWPETEFHAVQVGKEADVGRATKYVHPLDYGKDAEELPPYPSVPNYDAKVWSYAKNRPGALIWNVAGPVSESRAARPRWYSGDARDLVPHAPPADLLFSCPPYGDLEVYSDDPADISNHDWDEFVPAYREIIARAAERLREDRFAVFVVGNFRCKRTGRIRDLVGETIRAFEDAGLIYYNEGVLSTAIGSTSLRVSNSFSKSRKFGKVHQNVLVFVKGDGFRAAEALGEVRAYSGDDS